MLFYFRILSPLEMADRHLQARGMVRVGPLHTQVPGKGTWVPNALSQNPTPREENDLGDEFMRGMYVHPLTSGQVTITSYDPRLVDRNHIQTALTNVMGAFEELVNESRPTQDDEGWEDGYDVTVDPDDPDDPVPDADDDRCREDVREHLDLIASTRPSPPPGDDAPTDSEPFEAFDRETWSGLVILDRNAKGVKNTLESLMLTDIIPEYQGFEEAKVRRFSGFPNQRLLVLYNTFLKVDDLDRHVVAEEPFLSGEEIRLSLCEEDEEDTKPSDIYLSLCSTNLEPITVIGRYPSVRLMMGNWKLGTRILLGDLNLGVPGGPDHDRFIEELMCFFSRGLDGNGKGRELLDIFPILRTFQPYIVSSYDNEKEIRGPAASFAYRYMPRSMLSMRVGEDSDRTSTRLDALHVHIHLAQLFERNYQRKPDESWRGGWGGGKEDFFMISVSSMWRPMNINMDVVDKILKALQNIGSLEYVPCFKSYYHDFTNDVEG